MLALEHPYFARKAFHHAWTQATPQERIAFLVANPALHAELKARWTGANAWQRQWYVKNYPGIESLAAARHWAEITDRAAGHLPGGEPAIETGSGKRGRRPNPRRAPPWRGNGRAGL